MNGRYHPVLVALHWLLAALILFSLGMGMLSLTQIPNDSPLKLFALRGHMVAGLAILVLMLLRFVVRLVTARPPPATAGHPVLDRLARWMHYALYVVVILMAGSGLALALQAGLPAIVFGGSQTPLPDSFHIFGPRRAHGALAWILLALLAGHIAAALYHHYVRRDGLLRRMSFSSRRSSAVSQGRSRFPSTE